MIICDFGRGACGQPRSCRKAMVGQGVIVRSEAGNSSVIVSRRTSSHSKAIAGLRAEPLVGRARRPLLACAARPCLGSRRSAVRRMRSGFRVRAGCSSERFDRDAAAAPDKPVTAEDLVSADGACPGMAPRRRDANALTDGAAGSPAAATTRHGGARPHRMRCRARHRRADNVNLSTNGAAIVSRC